MNKEVFINRLQNLRKEKGLTQQALADLLHISNKTVSRWETGESYPDIELLPELSKIFDISLDELLSDQDIRTFKDFKKEDLVRYIPFVLSICSVILFYIFKALGVPSILSICTYLFINSSAFKILYRYTNRSDEFRILQINTFTFFFVFADLLISFAITLLTLYHMSIMDYWDFDSVYYSFTNIPGTYFGCYLISLVVSYFYYNNYHPKYQKTDEN